MSEERNNVSPEKTEQELNEQRKIRRDKLEQLRADGRDPFLYGEKIKAYLRRGARHLPGYSQWPNPELGFGTLCLSDSIPI